MDLFSSLQPAESHTGVKEPHDFTHAHHKCGCVLLQPELMVHWLDAGTSRHPTGRMLLPLMEVLIPEEQFLTVSNVILSIAVSSLISILLTNFHAAAFVFLFGLSPSQKSQYT